MRNRKYLRIGTLQQFANPFCHQPSYNRGAYFYPKLNITFGRYGQCIPWNTLKFFLDESKHSLSSGRISRVLRHLELFNVHEKSIETK